MSFGHFAVAPRQNRDLETEFTEAATHAIDDSFVLARVAGILYEPFNRPDLNLPDLGRFLRKHTSEIRRAILTRLSVAKGVNNCARVARMAV